MWKQLHQLSPPPSTFSVGTLTLRPPRRVHVQACSGVKIHTGLLSTDLSSGRCQFRICSSLRTRAAFVSSYAFIPVLSSRSGGYAQCCCSTCPPDHLLHSSSILASTPSPLGFCFASCPHH